MFFCPIGVPSDPRAVLRLAIAGDIHDQWTHQDHELLRCLRPDALLVVGDLSEGGQRIAAMLQQVEIPLACVLGNHDSGKDPVAAGSNSSWRFWENDTAVGVCANCGRRV